LGVEGQLTLVTEDAKLGAQLLASEKDQAEHVMLVDLARNDVNRVCTASTVKVDSLMQLEKFSHVQHITSQVSGMLREGKTRFDAFRSIFPAGTVSGAPKVKAIELISELEGERRGVYAGAVGHWDFADDEMDTCIAIRTMTFKDGAVYLQAGGGIVYDSVEEEEYVETLNKLKANIRTIDLAERGCFFPPPRSRGADGLLQSTTTNCNNKRKHNVARERTTQHFVYGFVHFIAMICGACVGAVMLLLRE